MKGSTMSLRWWLISTHFILLFLSHYVTAFPINDFSSLSAVSAGSLSRRQSTGPISASDDDGDEDSTTDALRNAYKYSEAYKGQPSANWYVIDSTTANPAFVLQATTAPNDPLPAPRDPEQGTSFQVDHVLELQVITHFLLDSTRPPQIPQAAWSKASSAAINGGAACTPIAQAAGSWDNLRGIPNRDNSFKNAVFQGAINHSPGPTPGKWYKYFADGTKNYLDERSGPVVQTIVPNIGTALAQASGVEGLETVFISAFGAYVQNIWNQCISILDHYQPRPGTTVGVGSASKPSPAPSVVPVSPLTTTDGSIIDKREKSLSNSNPVQGLARRQSSDFDNVEPDENDDEPDPDNKTEPLRDSYDATRYYKSVAPVIWDSINPGATDTDSIFRWEVTTSKGASPPAPHDKEQGAKFNVDHVLELQVITGMFEHGVRPANIPQVNWDTAYQVTQTYRGPNIPIAKAAAHVSNLIGITGRPNGFKAKIFTQAITGAGGPTPQTYYTYYAVAVTKYLQGRHDQAFDKAIPGIGDALATASGDSTLSTAFESALTQYAEGIWQQCYTLLSNYQGKAHPTVSNTAVARRFDSGQWTPSSDNETPPTSPDESQVDRKRSILSHRDEDGGALAKLTAELLKLD